MKRGFFEVFLRASKKYTFLCFRLFFLPKSPDLRTFKSVDFSDAALFILKNVLWGVPIGKVLGYTINR